MRPIDADFLLYCLKDVEVSGFKLKNAAMTDFFRRSFAEVVNEMPTLTKTKIADVYSSTICPICGRPFKEETDA